MGLLRQGTGVDERGHLADLHRGALHLAEHVEDALGGLELAFLGRRAALLLGARQVGGAGRVGAGRGAAGQPAQAGGAPDAAGGDRIAFTRHALTVPGEPPGPDHREPRHRTRKPR